MREQVVDEVAARVPRRGAEHVLVAVDGMDGAGKSVFAAELAEALRGLGRPVIEASLDGFHRRRVERYRRGRHSPEGFWLDSYDYSALRSALIDPLRPGGSGRYRTAVHDVATDELLEFAPATAAPGSVLVLDGLFLHRDELTALWDFSVFLDVPVSTSVRRLADRDGSVDDPTHPSLRRYVEGQRIYLATCSPRDRASLVIDNGDLLRPVIRSGRIAVVSELAPGALELMRETFGSVSVAAVATMTGSRRTTVERVSFTDAHGAPGSVVVKHYVERGDNALREPATLRLLRSQGVSGVVTVVAESATEPLLLLADLGSHPTLADRLLGTDRRAAEAAVIGWAKTVGRLHADTTGMRRDLERELAGASAFGGPAVDEMAEVLAACPGQVATVLETLDVAWNGGAAAELDVIARMLIVEEPGSAGGISPADTCPDNAVDTPDGSLLLDFEGGQYRHVAWDAAYLFLPWPSCWCAWRLPDDLATLAYETWQSEAARGIPAVLSAEFRLALDAARIGWAFLTLGWFLRSAIEHDEAMHPDRPTGTTPARRAVLQHRMATVVGLDAAPFPALRSLAEATLEAMQRSWGTLSLDVAPALRQ